MDLTLDQFKVSELGEFSFLLEAAGPLDLTVQSKIWNFSEKVKKWPETSEFVVGMTNILIMFNPLVTDALDFRKKIINAWTSTKTTRKKGKKVTIPIRYGGADLLEVAKYTGMSPEEVIRLHSQAEYIVFASGSSPGFAYLGGLPKELTIPRRAEPIPRAEGGSLLVGGSQTGVTWAAGPTGWYILGQAEIPVFDPLKNPPTLLSIGDIVKFENTANK